MIFEKLIKNFDRIRKYWEVNPQNKKRVNYISFFSGYASCILLIQVPGFLNISWLKIIFGVLITALVMYGIIWQIENPDDDLLISIVDYATYGVFVSLIGYVAYS